MSCVYFWLFFYIGRAADREKFMSASDFEVLRACYVSQLNFTGMSFDRALRYFLCDANFLLPGEGQKVDRLMMAFRSVGASVCGWEIQSTEWPQTNARIFFKCTVILHLPKQGISGRALYYN